MRILPLIKGWNFAFQNIEDVGISIILMVDHMWVFCYNYLYLNISYQQYIALVLSYSYTQEHLSYWQCCYKDFEDDKDPDQNRIILKIARERIWRNITLITKICMLHAFSLCFWAKIQKADTGVMILVIAQPNCGKQAVPVLRQNFFNKTLVKVLPIP